MAVPAIRVRLLWLDSKCRHWPLILVVGVVFALRVYLTTRDPVLHIVDPWNWASIVEAYSRGDLFVDLSGIFPSADFYPKAFPLLAALISVVTGVSGYEVVRFYPIISALNLIPMYFLALAITNSRRTATASIVFVSMSKWYMIRTSIGNAESFFHFWLALSLLFLLRVCTDGTRRSILACVIFTTATLMFWQFPIEIYAVLFVVLALFNLRKHMVLKRLMLVTLGSVLMAGLFWYFWVDPIRFLQTMLQEVNGVIFVQDTPKVSTLQSLSAFAQMHFWVLSLGYVMPFLGMSGFAYSLACRRPIRDRRMRFLCGYLVSILALVAMTPGFTYLRYLSSILALPLSIFAAFALVGIVDTFDYVIRTRLGKLISLPGQLKWDKPTQKLVLTAFVELLVILTIANSANFGGPTHSGLDCSVEATGCILYDPFVEARSMRFGGQEWVVTYDYVKWYDAPSNGVYYALRWVREHSSGQSSVVAFLANLPESTHAVIHRAFPAISDRKFLEGTTFADYMISPTAFLSAVLGRSGGEVYVIIGVKSWLEETLADPNLESLFLNFAIKLPDVFPEVYSSQGTRVFHIANDQEPRSSIAPLSNFNSAYRVGLDNDGRPVICCQALNSINGLQQPMPRLREMKTCHVRVV